MYINGLKYACSTCIKGHRSSHCSHVDRPLFEIRKKGRPVTQCTFCRDLRKTKQVHIKCACSDKKVNATSEKPILIYKEDKCQEIKNNNIVTNKHGQQCTCPNNTTTINNTQSPKLTYLQKSNVTQESPTQMNVTQDSSSILAPLCPTAPSLVKEEQLSYSWALITSPSANQIELPTETIHTINNNNNNNLFTDMMLDTEDDDISTNQHLGFIFHKPTSTQRFLDGQPRIRRRRSTNQKRNIAANSITVTPTNYNNNNTTRLPVNALVDLTIDTMNDYNLSTPSTMSPHHISSATSSAPTTGISHDPMDIQFDYLTEQLKILSSTSQSSNQGFIGDLANADELTAILNNVLQKDDDDNISLPSVSSYGPMETSTIPKNMNNNSNTPVMPTVSHCGSFVPLSKCCKPVGSIGGESVVITITPLTNTNEDKTNNNSMLMMLEDDQTQQKTTTRIVTCYCGNQCTCPGCLVHPGNFFLGTDPYSGLMMNPSSSASSSCYGSDEEELSSIYTKSNHFISF